MHYVLPYCAFQIHFAGCTEYYDGIAPMSTKSSLEALIHARRRGYSDRGGDLRVLPDPPIQIQAHSQCLWHRQILPVRDRLRRKMLQGGSLIRKLALI